MPLQDFPPLPDLISPAPSAARNLNDGFAKLGQNYPNPYSAETTIPFTLTVPADVQLAIFDPLGRKIASVIRKELAPGRQTIALTLRGLGLRAGNYIYQLQVTSRFGTHRQSKTMTVVQEPKPE